MITELTPEQEARLDEYRDIGLAIGLSTHDPEKFPSHMRLHEMLAEVYKVAGLVVPPSRAIYYAESPYDGARKAACLQAHRRLDDELLAGINQEQIREQLDNAAYGTQDAHWLTFYRYFVEVCGLQLEADIMPLVHLSQYIGWWWPFDEAVVVSKKPTEIHMRGERLHREGDKAVKYADGFGVYALNGVRFEDSMAWCVTTPAGQLDAKAVLNIQNAEQRAETIKRIGIDKLFWELGPTKLDQDDSHGYELYSVPVYEDMPRIYLKMQNPSVDEIHIEPVHPDCSTVQQALHWRNFGSVELPAAGFQAPAQLT